MVWEGTDHEAAYGARHRTRHDAGHMATHGVKHNTLYATRDRLGGWPGDGDWDEDCAPPGAVHGIRYGTGNGFRMRLNIRLEMEAGNTRRNWAVQRMGIYLGLGMKLCMGLEGKRGWG